MSIDKIVGWIGILAAVVGAFVQIPFITLILVIAGLIVGFKTPREDHVRVIVSAVALTTFAHILDAVPSIGSYVGTVLGNFALVVAGAALMIMLRNTYLRFKP